MHERLAWGLLACLLVGAAQAQEWRDDGHRVVVRASGEFADIRSNLEQAIIGAGLTVSTVGHVGEMLERTAPDLGFTGSPVGHADVVEFCSALLTRRMVEANPADLVQCPYRIAVYTLPGEAGSVYLAFAKPTASGATPPLEAIEQLLRRLVEESL